MSNAWHRLVHDKKTSATFFCYHLTSIFSPYHFHNCMLLIFNNKYPLVVFTKLGLIKLVNHYRIRFDSDSRVVECAMIVYRKCLLSWVLSLHDDFLYGQCFLFLLTLCLLPLKQSIRHIYAAKQRAYCHVTSDLHLSYNVLRATASNGETNPSFHSSIGTDSAISGASFSNNSESSSLHFRFALTATVFDALALIPFAKKATTADQASNFASFLLNTIDFTNVQVWKKVPIWFLFLPKYFHFLRKTKNKKKQKQYELSYGKLYFDYHLSVFWYWAKCNHKSFLSSLFFHFLNKKYLILFHNPITYRV